MLDLGLTTVPEKPEPTRSDSHAWSAHPNYGLLATVLGGSTNLVLHLIAMARSVGLSLSLEDFQAVSDRTPLLSDFKPSGRFVMEDLHKVGGTPAVLKLLLEEGRIDALDLDEALQQLEALDERKCKVVELRCTYDPATRGGSSPDGRKVKATLHWVSAGHAIDAEVRLYDRLFNEESPGADYRADLNPASLERLEIEHAARGPGHLSRRPPRRRGRATAGARPRRSRRRRDTRRRSRRRRCRS